MTAPTRRQLIAGGTATAAGVALLAGGGRALAAPEVAAQPHPAVPPTADPTGLSPFGFMFPGLDPLRVDPDPGVALARLQALAASMLDPNVTTPTAGNRDNVGSGSIFTYFGQFLDHDITLDLEPQPTRFFAQSRHGLLLDDDDGKPVRNNESFRFDLSCAVRRRPGTARRSSTRPTESTSASRSPTPTASGTCPATPTAARSSSSTATTRTRSSPRST